MGTGQPDRYQGVGQQRTADRFRFRKGDANMLPILAAIGVSMLSTLAQRAVSAVVEGSLGGRATEGSGNNSFDAVLERSAAQSTQAPVQVSNTLTSRRPSVVGGSARATDLIGRKIAANGSAFEVRGGLQTILRYRLPTAAATVQMEVRDLRGNLVRTVPMGPQPGGLHQLPFDGRGLPSGLYLYRIVAADAAGQPIARVSTATGRVMGVQFENGQPFLNVGSALVPLGGIFDVSSLQPSAVSSSPADTVS